MENDNKITVLCVEDEAVIAMDIQGSVDEQPDMRSVGCLAAADNLLAEIACKKPNVVLLDLTMPGKDAFSALSEIAKQHPQTRVIVYSGYFDQALIDMAMEAGAWGYVVKSGDIESLIQAIRVVAKGELHFPG